MALNIPILKVTLIGLCETGKTQICSQYTNNGFQYLYEPTVDEDSYRKLEDISDNPESKDEIANYVMIELNDLWGLNNTDLEQEQKEINQTIMANSKPPPDEIQQNFIYIKKVSMGFMFVYDVTNYNTFKDLLSYIQVIDEAEKKDKNLIPTYKMLIGNKCDLGVDMVPEEEVLKTQNDFDMLPHQKVSALENSNIKKCMVLMAKYIYNEKELWKMESKEKGGTLGINDIKQDVIKQMGKLNTGIISKVAGVITCAGRNEKKQVVNMDDHDSDARSDDKSLYNGSNDEKESDDDEISEMTGDEGEVMKKKKQDGACMLF